MHITAGVTISMCGQPATLRMADHPAGSFILQPSKRIGWRHALPIGHLTSSACFKKIHSDAHSYGASELNVQALTAFRVVKTQSEKNSPNHGDCGDKTGESYG